MSRASTRAAVKAWFSPPNVTLLNSVHRAQPKTVPGTDFFITAGAQSGAVGIVDIANESERRIAIGGPTDGLKEITYEVLFTIWFRSTQPDAEAAMDDYDSVIDSFKARLRADRTLGAAVFQAGEGDPQSLGSPDVHVQHEAQRLLNNGEMHKDARIRFLVVEFQHT